MGPTSSDTQSWSYWEKVKTTITTTRVRRSRNQNSNCICYWVGGEFCHGSIQVKYVPGRGNSQCKDPGQECYGQTRSLQGLWSRGVRTMPFACAVCCDITQSWQTKAPRAKSSLQPVFINKVLLAHNHSLSLIYCLWPLSCSNCRVKPLWISCIKALSVKRPQVTIVSILEWYLNCDTFVEPEHNFHHHQGWITFSLVAEMFMS